MHRLATLTAWWVDRPGRNLKDDSEKIGVEDKREYLRDGLLNQPAQTGGDGDFKCPSGTVILTV